MCQLDVDWTYLFELEDDDAAIDMPTTVAGVSGGFTNPRAYYTGNQALSQVSDGMQVEICSGIRSGDGNCNIQCNAITPAMVGSVAGVTLGLSDFQTMIACFTGQCSSPSRDFLSCNNVNTCGTTNWGTWWVANSYRPPSRTMNVRGPRNGAEHWHFDGWGLTMYHGRNNELAIEATSHCDCTQKDTFQIRYRP